MAKEKFTAKQQEMLKRAQKIIDDESLLYVNILTQHIQDLPAALHSSDIDHAIRICHLIQTQAGTFGWPLATEIAGWFKRLLKSQQQNGLKEDVNELFMESFRILLDKELKTESDNALKLLLHMESELKKSGNAI